MNLYNQLLEREKNRNPIRVCLIGAGKFGTMYLSQASRTPGITISTIVDLNPSQAKQACIRSGIGETDITDNTISAISSENVDLVIDATGSPEAGISNALACCEHGKDIIMVNVEADALAGPLLAEKARESNIVYSLAYGDQPALICEQVDWARTCGLEVIAAGKGTKYLEGYHYVTPNEVWQHYGITAEQADIGGMNPKMFNSFLDGTKSAIEMAAVSNATNLAPSPSGLSFPPVGVRDLPLILRPKEEGGCLHHKGQVEVISSEERDGRHVYGDLRWGVYVVFKSPSDYVTSCFAEYGLQTDPSGQYSALWKPFHLIGLELGISVASVALRREPTGQARGFIGDVVATAKKNLRAGEILDGEGGFTVYGKLLPASDSLASGGLPIGLANKVKLKNSIKMNHQITWKDVDIDKNNQAVKVRKEMELMFSDKNPGNNNFI